MIRGAITPLEAALLLAETIWAVLTTNLAPPFEDWRVRRGGRRVARPDMLLQAQPMYDVALRVAWG